MGFSLFHFILPAGFILLNIYLARRAWQALKAWFPGANLYVFLAVYALLMSTFVLERADGALNNDTLSYYLAYAGSVMMVATIYALIACLAVDLVRAADHFLHFLPEDRPYLKVLGPSVLLLLCTVLGYGIWNARHPVITHYDVHISKAGGNLDSLHVVMVSDIHAGVILHNGRIQEMGDQINSLQPDIVLMPGDIVDQSLSRLTEEDVAATFARIKSRYGTYACPGNHEHLDGNEPGAIQTYLKEGNINMLSDQAALIDNSFYIVGRSDSDGFTETEASNNGPSAGGLLDGLDRSKPLLVLDHKPTRLKDEEAAGIDLVLSGHTHAGQFWPVNLFTERLFTVDYGYYRDGALQAIVSSGWGTWGPPLRIGSDPEIVDITIYFDGPAAAVPAE